MRILLLAPAAQTPGGVVTYANMLKTHLQECDVHWLAVGSNPSQPENRFMKCWRLLHVPFDVVALLGRESFNVVHINPSLDAKSLLRDGLILLALRLVGFRHTLVSFHGWQPALLDNIFVRAPLRWLLNGCACVTVLAPEFKTSLEQSGVRNVVLTRTMFDGTLFADKKIITPARRSILYLSRLVKQKGIYALLDAFIALAADFPDVDLIFAGSGEERDRLHAAIAVCPFAARISLKDYVTGGEKAALLQQCTIFALPTYYPEGMPIVLLEAMAAGRPVLTANAGGIRHIVHEPENGIVLETVSSVTVEHALRKLLSDPAYCAATGAYNAIYAWEHFEAGKVCADIENLYRRIGTTA